VEEERITQIDVEEWPITILILSEEYPETVLHTTMYQETPSDLDLASLKAEFIEEFNYQDDPDKLQYAEITTKEFMDLLEDEEID